MLKGPQGQSLPPGWTIRVEEVGPAHWRVECFHHDGRSVSRDGLDPEALEAQCIADAAALPEKRLA
jgi:hypothetical protein